MQVHFRCQFTQGDVAGQEGVIQSISPSRLLAGSQLLRYRSELNLGTSAKTDHFRSRPGGPRRSDVTDTGSRENAALVSHKDCRWGAEGGGRKDGLERGEEA
ncbi:hypothetical protein PoB_002561500 [Plakobranchus ocellatus]|uniref:Uncharacterized protein n=1 Tax=Plakobranchus ocellatus TaxID=259542 RepID=A0AAV3ZTE7_9GAST|nr:hypothetical protein PoB_002561500 [Plakobranchus ocellatus]